MEMLVFLITLPPLPCEKVEFIKYCSATLGSKMLKASLVFFFFVSWLVFVCLFFARWGGLF